MTTGIFWNTKTQEIFILPIQDVLVHFLNKLKETYESIKQPIVVSSVIDELRNKRHLLETSEVDKHEKLQNPHHWLLQDLA